MALSSQEKDEVFEKFKEFRFEVETQTERKIKVMRSEMEVNTLQNNL